MAGVINFNNYSSNYYKSGTKYTAVPFSKFQWTIRFETIADSGNGPFEGFSNITYIAQTVELPSWDIESQTLNQYNKRRVVNTHVTLKPVSITFIDTVDSLFRSFILAYMNHTSQNFGLANSDTFDGADAIISKDMLSDSFNGNYGQKVANGSIDNFISTLQINQEFGGEVTPVQLLNPKITSVTRDGLDYTQTTGFSKWTVTFQPEGIRHLPKQTHPDYKASVAGAIKTPSLGALSASSGSGTGLQQNVANIGDAISNGTDITQTSGAITASMNNIQKNIASESVVIKKVLASPGGTITQGLAINGSSMSGAFGDVKSVVNTAMAPVAAISGIAGALTQLPGMQQYAKGPLGKIASTGLKIRALNNMFAKGPAALSNLDKYIKGFNMKSITGGWL
jgi:hypothetical protein